MLMDRIGFYIGRVKERGTCSADVEKQHNGIDPFGVYCYYVEFSDCVVDDERQRWTIKRINIGWPKRYGILHQVFLHIGLFPGGVLVERAVYQVLQPCQHSD